MDQELIRLHGPVPVVSRWRLRFDSYLQRNPTSGRRFQNYRTPSVGVKEVKALHHEQANGYSRYFMLALALQAAKI